MSQLFIGLLLVSAARFYRGNAQCSHTGENGYQLSWEFDELTGLVTFDLLAGGPNGGINNFWTGVSFGPGMYDLDGVLVVSQNGQVSALDVNSIDYAAPTADPQTDVQLISSSAVDGGINARFARPLISSDNGDKQLNECQMWAFAELGGNLAANGAPLKHPKTPLIREICNVERCVPQVAATTSIGTQPSAAPVPSTTAQTTNTNTGNAVDGPCIIQQKYIFDQGGANVPDCTKDGFYQSIQCESTTGQCYCADSVTGAELPGTRTSAGINPTCTDAASFVQSGYGANGFPVPTGIDLASKYPDYQVVERVLNSNSRELTKRGQEHDSNTDTFFGIIDTEYAGARADRGNRELSDKTNDENQSPFGEEIRAMLYGDYKTGDGTGQYPDPLDEIDLNNYSEFLDYSLSPELESETTFLETAATDGDVHNEPTGTTEGVKRPDESITTTVDLSNLQNAKDNHSAVQTDLLYPEGANIDFAFENVDSDVAEAKPDSTVDSVQYTLEADSPTDASSTPSLDLTPADPLLELNYPVDPVPNPSDANYPVDPATDPLNLQLPVDPVVKPLDRNYPVDAAYSPFNENYPVDPVPDPLDLDYPVNPVLNYVESAPDPTNANSTVGTTPNPSDLNYPVDPVPNPLDLNYPVDPVPNPVDPNYPVDPVPNPVDLNYPVDSAPNPVDLNYPVDPVPNPVDLNYPVDPVPNPVDLNYPVDPVPNPVDLNYPVDPVPNPVDPNYPVDPVPNPVDLNYPVDPAPNPVDLNYPVDPVPNPVDLNYPVDPVPNPVDLNYPVDPVPNPVDLNYPVDPVPNPVDLNYPVDPVPNPVDLNYPVDPVPNPVDLNYPVDPVPNPVDLNYPVDPVPNPVDLNYPVDPVPNPLEASYNGENVPTVTETDVQTNTDYVNAPVDYANTDNLPNQPESLTAPSEHLLAAEEDNQSVTDSSVVNQTEQAETDRPSASASELDSSSTVALPDYPDYEGTTIDDQSSDTLTTRSPPSTSDVIAGPQPCLERRLAAIELQDGSLVPECAEDGLFVPVQCSAEECWCVNAGTGVERVATRVPLDQKPDNCEDQLETDPCLDGPCADNEQCVIETKACLTTPCPQYKCTKPDANAEVPAGCNANQPDLSVCDSYFEEYFGRVNSWSKVHKVSPETQYSRACSLIAVVPGVKTLCCIQLAQKCSKFNVS